MGEDNVFMVGYGTFITNETYLNSKDVKVCIVPKHRRMWLKTTIFPFILPDPTFSGIHALIFSINKGQLKNLDIYEGVEAGLYSREEISVEDLKGNNLEAYIYIPTEKCIAEYELSLDKDPTDCWMEEIRKNSNIYEKYPQLIKKLD